jgi:hypothetical protein
MRFPGQPELQWHDRPCKPRTHSGSFEEKELYANDWHPAPNLPKKHHHDAAPRSGCLPVGLLEPTCPRALSSNTDDDIGAACYPYSRANVWSDRGRC